ncbi:MAG: EAL domain-containing protein [Gammaproteobacteria bacterium]|nr:EAL domain-containing protein [Gammaproteobacteria bacterium]
MIGSNMQREYFPKGTKVFREGEPGTYAYLIENGKIEISAATKGARIEINVLGPGDLFGEMALIDNHSRSATATALEDTRVIPLEKSALESKISKSDPVLHLLLRVVLERFRWALRRVLDRERLLSTGALGSSEQDKLYEEAKEQAVNQLRLEQDLHEAIEKQQFQVHYQPIVETMTGAVVGYEALTRWIHPKHGYVSPAEFIEAAEDSGLIIPLGLWILERACEDLKRFQKAVNESGKDDDRQLFMSVNVSPRQLQQLTSDGTFVRIINETGVDPSNLKLELTEALLIQSPEVAAIALARLKETGVQLAIDDFGTGYSSLSYLHRFPFDVLKIDRAFINSMVKEKKSKQIVVAIMGLAHGLGLKVVAEGIEDQSTVDMVKEWRCEFMQGYYFAKPRPAPEILGGLIKSSAA